MPQLFRITAAVMTDWGIPVRASESATDQPITPRYVSCWWPIGINVSAPSFALPDVIERVTNTTDHGVMERPIVVPRVLVRYP